MQEEEIFAVIKKIIYEIIPQQKEKPININESLRDLGANSIDRAEIIIRTMEELNIKVPMIEFANSKNIKEIVMIISEKLPTDD